MEILKQNPYEDLCEKLSGNLQEYCSHKEKFAGLLCIQDCTHPTIAFIALRN